MKKPPPNFASLAQRISTYTTRGILCAGVVAAALAFGRQVLIWWRVDELSLDGKAGNAAALDALADARRPHSIAFGDGLLSLRRESFAGQKLLAARRLVAMAQAVLNSSEIAAAAKNNSSKIPPAEQKMFASLEGRQPAGESAGKWQIYELHDAFPMIVGIARITSGVSAKPDAPAAKEKQKKLADQGYRLVLWGMGMPVSTTEWTLCLGVPRGIVSEKAELETPLPPGCRRTMALGVDEGGRMSVFTGPGEPETWMQFFTDWSRRHGWKTTSDWRQHGNIWSAAFASSDGDSLEARLASDAHGHWTGFLLTTQKQKKQN